MKKLRQSTEDKLGSEGIALEEYFKSLYAGSYPKVLEETFSLDQSFLQVPLSEAKFLELLIRIKQPKKILEVGAFRGFSTVFLSYLKTAQVTTIEKDERRFEEIESILKKTGVAKRVNLLKGDAKSVLIDLKKAKQTFDFIFIDANKKEVTLFFDLCFKLLKKQGVVIIDNTLWAGEVTKEDPESNSAKSMKVFNDYVFKQFPKDAYILPGWDGVTVVVKK